MFSVVSCLLNALRLQVLALLFVNMFQDQLAQKGVLIDLFQMPFDIHYLSQIVPICMPSTVTLVHNYT